MTKKPQLSIVGPQLTSPLAPPPGLQKAGRELWTDVHSAYDVSDVAGKTMLLQACCMLDRADLLASEIAADGCVTRTKEGVKAHPGCKEELGARAFVVRVLDRLGLPYEPLRLGPGRPGGRGAA
jgi:hypothetical protein